MRSGLDDLAVIPKHQTANAILDLVALWRIAGYRANTNERAVLKAPLHLLVVGLKSPETNAHRLPSMRGTVLRACCDDRQQHKCKPHITKDQPSNRYASTSDLALALVDLSSG